METPASPKAQRQIFADRRIFISIVLSLLLWFVVVGPGIGDGWTAEGHPRVSAGQWIRAGKSLVLRHPSMGELELSQDAEFRLLSERGPEGVPCHHFELQKGSFHCRLADGHAPLRLDLPQIQLTSFGHAPHALWLEAKPVGWLAEAQKGEWILSSPESVSMMSRRRLLMLPDCVAVLIPSHGPGIPFMKDAPAPFVPALRPEIEVDTVVDLARLRDTITLVNLIPFGDTRQKNLIRNKLLLMRIPCPALSGLENPDDDVMESLWESARKAALSTD